MMAMRNSEDKKYYNGYTSRMMSLSVLILAFSVFIYMAVTKSNPDGDSFWLISTGRWIVENNKIPKTNPWTFDSGLSVIVQQPLCAVLNYLWHEQFGLTGMWMLAVVENFILLIAMIDYVSLFSNNKTHTFSTVAIMEFVISVLGLGTTRPYQLTIACSFFLLSFLERCKRKDKVKPIFFILMIVVLFQANYQMASLPIQFCFLFAYALGSSFDRLKNGQKLRELRFIVWILLFVEFFALSLLNPYGLNGATYLIKSRNALSILSGKIVEMQRPAIISATGILILICVFCFAYNFRKTKTWDWCELFLLLGAIIASSLALRNLWMLLVSFSISYTKAFNEKERIPEEQEKENKGKYIANRIITEVLPQNLFWMNGLLTKQDSLNENAVKYKIMRNGLLVGSLLVLFSTLFISPKLAESTYDKKYKDLIGTINSLPEDAKTYSSFNTGAFLEYCGRKCYIDARPELYSYEITESKNLLSEWYNMEWKDMNFEEYVTSSDWDYYLVVTNTPIEFYFRFSKTAEALYAADDICLYKCN